ncbi:MAG: SpoIIE family protein phosphatase, partial [Pseudomonas sp.]
PLGVLAPERFDDSTQVLPLALGQRLFLLSDGVVDTSDDNDQLFGVERLRQVLVANRQPELLFEEVLGALEAFRGRCRDDVSLLEIGIVDPDALSPAPMAYSDSGQCAPLDWSLQFEFRAETLKRFNPLPYLLQLLQEIHGLRAQSGALHSVLNELYSNALEHGVLGLDSALKRDARGFAEYYRQRNERLQALNSGYIRLSLRVEPHGLGGRLIIEVEDSGKGFNVHTVLARPLVEQGLYGRGLNLIRRLSRHVEWADEGRRVCVEFTWEALA